MKKIAFLFILSSQLIFSQITDQSGNNAADENGNKLTGHIRIGNNSGSVTTNLRVNGAVTSRGDAGFIMKNGQLLIGSIYGDDITTLITAFGDDISAGSAIALGEETLIFKTNNQNALYINQHQRIGIGTTSPLHKLHLVQGNIMLESDQYDGLQIKFKENDLGDLYDFGVDGGLEAYRFDINGSNKMNIHKNGNVGIGTISPDEKLAVNGSIHAKEVRVNLVGWPDYVFDEEYELPSLTDVEAYINTNGHLEQIPSATEVEKEGVKLGEMNKLLLQKVEELTLYTIEQQKNIDKLQVEMKALLSMIKKMDKPTN